VVLGGARYGLDMELGEWGEELLALTGRSVAPRVGGSPQGISAPGDFVLVQESVGVLERLCVMCLSWAPFTVTAVGGPAILATIYFLADISFVL